MVELELHIPDVITDPLRFARAAASLNDEIFVSYAPSYDKIVVYDAKTVRLELERIDGVTEKASPLRRHLVTAKRILNVNFPCSSMLDFKVCVS